MKHLWANGKVERLCRRGHRVKPRGGHNFCIRHIGQSRAATWRLGIGPPHVQSSSSQLPRCRQVTAMSPSVRPVSSMLDRIRTAMCHLVIGPYCTDATCHPLSDVMCRLLVGPYTYHVILSIPYECHVSPYQWFHVIMFV